MNHLANTALAALATVTVALAPTAAVARADVPNAKQATPSQAELLLEQTQRHPLFNGVNLTEAQVERLLPLLEATSTRINGVLSPEQQETFMETLEASGIDAAFASLNLSPEQEAQLDGILQGAAAGVLEVFTPAQINQLQQNVLLMMGS